MLVRTELLRTAGQDNRYPASVSASRAQGEDEFTDLTSEPLVRTESDGHHEELLVRKGTSFTAGYLDQEKIRRTLSSV